MVYDNVIFLSVLMFGVLNILHLLVLNNENILSIVSSNYKINTLRVFTL